MAVMRNETRRDTECLEKRDTPSVSVIVPVYNGCQTIARCIEALLAQDGLTNQFEIIIVDNNSTDGTVDIVNQYPVTLLYEQDIQTSYAARNRGIRHASGEIVAFTDADCIADPYWIKELILPFTNRTVAGVVGKVASCKATTIIEEFTSHVDPLGKKSVGGLISMITANVAYRRDILEQLGCFQSDMYTGADVDLGWRVQQLPGFQVEYVPQAVVLHMHRTTLSGLYHQFRRYGYSEIMLDTLYRDQDFYSRKPGVQLRIMLRQVKALVTYLLSIVSRFFRSILFGWDPKHVVWPALWFVVESSNLLGKLSGLISTRLFTRKP